MANTNPTDITQLFAEFQRQLNERDQHIGRLQAGLQAGLQAQQSSQPTTSSNVAGASSNTAIAAASQSKSKPKNSQDPKPKSKYVPSKRNPLESRRHEAIRRFGEASTVVQKLNTADFISFEIKKELHVVPKELKYEGQCPRIPPCLFFNLQKCPFNLHMHLEAGVKKEDIVAESDRCLMPKAFTHACHLHKKILHRLENHTILECDIIQWLDSNYPGTVPEIKEEVVELPGESESTESDQDQGHAGLIMPPPRVANPVRPGTPALSVTAPPTASMAPPPTAKSPVVGIAVPIGTTGTTPPGVPSNSANLTPLNLNVPLLHGRQETTDVPGYFTPNGARQRSRAAPKRSSTATKDDKKKSKDK